MPRKLLPLLLLMVLPAGLLAADSPSTATGQRSGNSWSAGTRQSPPQPPMPLAPLTLTVYQGFGDHGPGPGAADRPLAVDVTSVMTQCPDGSVIVTALVIGGQLRPLDNRCPRNAPPIAPSPTGARPAPPDRACDAGSWNCSTRPTTR